MSHIIAVNNPVRPRDTVAMHAAIAGFFLSIVAASASAEALHTLSSPNEEQGGSFGFSVCGAGDVDGDGYADVMVGAPGEDPGSDPHDVGRAYVFSGQTGALLRTLVSPNEELLGEFGYSGASGFLVGRQRMMGRRSHLGYPSPSLTLSAVTLREGRGGGTRFVGSASSVHPWTQGIPASSGAGPRASLQGA